MQGGGSLLSRTVAGCTRPTCRLCGSRALRRMAKQHSPRVGAPTRP